MSAETIYQYCPECNWIHAPGQPYCFDERDTLSASDYWERMDEGIVPGAQKKKAN